jgi:hypothetical protein
VKNGGKSYLFFFFDEKNCTYDVDITIVRELAELIQDVAYNSVLATESTALDEDESADIRYQEV